MRAAASATISGPLRAALAVIAGASALCLVLPAPSVLASAGFGPLSGPGGCLVGPTVEETGGCGRGNGLLAPSAVAVSPDGANVYVASGPVGTGVATSYGSVAILKREQATGAISEVGCLSSDGTDGRDGASGSCTAMPSLLGADGVAVSPNGLNVFVTAAYSGTVVAFARNPVGGSLTRLGCFQFRPVGGSPCPAANVFTTSGALVTSANGRSLFIAAPTLGSISTLTAETPEPGRAGGTGPSGVAPAATGPEATVASIFGAPTSQVLANSCIAVNGYDGACAVGVATQGLEGLALSPEGKQVYGAAPGSNAIDVFTPGASGLLAETSCVKVEAPPGLCTSSKLMTAPKRLAVSPDGNNVYAADDAEATGKLDVFDRNPTTGALTESSCLDDLAPENHPDKEEAEQEEQEKQEPQEPQEPGPPDQCTSVPGLASAEEVAVSGDGSEVYAFGDGSAAIFARNASTGALTEVSCADSNDSHCTSLPSLDGVDGAAVSPDGRQVYIAAKDSNEVAVLGIGAAVTSATASATGGGPARVAVACPPGLGTSCAGRVILLRSLAVKGSHRRTGRRVRRSRAGDSSIFTIRPGENRTISVRLSGSAVRLLRKRRHIRLMAVVVAKPAAGGSGYGRPLVLRLRR